MVPYLQRGLPPWPNNAKNTTSNLFTVLISHANRFRLRQASRVSECGLTFIARAITRHLVHSNLTETRGATLMYIVTLWKQERPTLMY